MGCFVDKIISSQLKGSRAWLLTSLALLLAPTPYGYLHAHGDFIQTMASGVYQSTDGQTKVVLSTKPGAQGLFVLVGPATAPQEFNIEAFPAKDTKHIFIRFNGDAQPPVYSEIVINKKSYKISGNVTIGIGPHTSVSIDNNNPYLTIVTESTSKLENPAILGFLGLNEVVREKGSLATLLAANQLNAEISRVIRPYLIEGDMLLLNGKPVSTPFIGTFVKPENNCLYPGYVIFSAAQTAKIRSTKVQEQRLKLIEQFLVDNKKSSPFKDYLVLKADKSSAILLNVKEKNISELHVLSEERKICIISDIATS